jgi:chromosome segregation ATPase
MDLSSLKSLLTENRDTYNNLQKEYSDLSNHLRQLEEDFERISGEHNRAQNERDRELADLRAQAEAREQAIAAVLENNVSLRFEINTYRRLLEVEEGHLGRIDVEKPPRFDSNISDVSTKKMTVQKSARGELKFNFCLDFMMIFF